MNLTKISVLNSKILYLAIYFLFTSFILISSSWNVDPLHDGATFPSAVAVAQGRTIFIDVQNQYGLLQAIIEGLAIHIFGPYLIVSRLTGSLVVLVTSILIFLCCKKFVNTKIALGLATIYLALTPGWNYAPIDGWPSGAGSWPNTYGVLFQLIFIYLILIQRNNNNSIILFFCGTALAISSFARIEFLLASFIIFTITLGTIKKNKLKFIFGYLLVLFTVLIISSTNGSLKYMYIQIVSALFDSGDNSVSMPSIESTIKSIIVIIFTSSLLIILALGKKWMAIVQLYFVVMILNFIVYKNVQNKSGKLFSFVELVSKDTILTIIPLVILIVAIYIGQQAALDILFSRHISRNRQIIRINWPIYTTCLTSFFQLHNLNYGYMYFILPIFLVALGCIYGEKNVNLPTRMIGSLTKKILQNIITALFLVSTSNFMIGITSDSKKFDAPHLKHIRHHNFQNYYAINNITSFISTIPIGKTISNNCAYGLYSVNQNGYISNSRYPWNLLSAEQLKDKYEIDNTVLADFTLYCGDTKSILDAAKPGMSEVESFTINQYERLTIYEKNSDK